MQVARAKDVLPGDDDQLAQGGLAAMSSVSPQMIQSAMHNRFIKYLHSETLNSAGHPLGIADVSRLSVGNMTTLQHLLTAFSALSIFHCIVAVATLVVGWRLLHVQ
uniref:Uncharacterized protein n=1 Tax=Plectus sambesii TaxID=2011161 RepID=A0A914UQA4_9BILA